MTRYVINRSVSFTFPAPGLVQASNSPRRFPVAVHHALVGFSESASVEAVHARLDPDVSLSEFRKLLAPWIEAGVLIAIPDERALDRRLRAVWNKRLFEDEAAIAQIRAALSRGRAVVLRDAFHPAYADEVHATLDGYNQWHPHEVVDRPTAPDFHYRHHDLYDERSPFPPVLSECRALSARRG
jgi:hypothetical protein